MNLSYPLKDGALKRFLTADEHYEINEKQPPNLDHAEKGGWFPIGINNFWHAGVHLDGDRPVHAVADGKIVAYRVSDDFIHPSDLEKTFTGGRGQDRTLISFPISHNFVLTRHRFEPPGEDPFSFYLLYMHLLPLEELKRRQKRPLAIFHQSVVKVKRCDDLDGRGLLLFDEAGNELATMPKGAAVELCEQEGRPPEQVRWAHDRGFRQVRFTFYGETFTGFARLDGHTKPDPADGNRYLVTTDTAPNHRKNGINVRNKDGYYGSEVIDIAPVGAIMRFDKTEGDLTTETGALRSFPRGERYRKITGYVHENREYRVEGYVFLDSRYFETEKRHDPVVNRVEHPEDLEIRQGDVLGWCGRDGSAENKRMVHLELFVTSDKDLTALRSYTQSQQLDNTGLEREELLQLQETRILNEQDITAAYIRTEFVSYVSDLIAKASGGRENLIKLTPEEAVTEETVAPLLRQMVVKHHPEWLPFDKDEKMKERWMYPPYKWPQEKYDAYRELYLEKFAFWHLLRDHTDESRDSWQKRANIGSPFPDEVYFFHPIKFIEHLKLISEKHFYLETTEFSKSYHSALFPGGMLTMSFSYKGHILYYPKENLTEDDFKDTDHIEAAIGAFFSKFEFKKMTREELTMGHEYSEISLGIPIRENPMEELHWFGYKPIRRNEWDCSAHHGEYYTTVGFHADIRWLPYEEDPKHDRTWSDSIGLLVRDRIRRVTAERKQKEARLKEAGLNPETFEKVDPEALEKGWFRYVGEHVAPELANTIREDLLDAAKVWFDREEHKHRFRFEPVTSGESPIPTISFDQEMVKDMLLLPLGEGTLKLEMSIHLQAAIAGNSAAKLNVWQKTVDITGARQGEFSTTFKFSKDGMIEVSSGSGVKLPFKIGNLKADWVFELTDPVPKLKLTFESNPLKLSAEEADQPTKDVLGNHLIKPRFELLISYLPQGPTDLKRDRRFESKEKPFQVPIPAENQGKYHSPTTIDDLSDNHSGVGTGEIVAIVASIIAVALFVIALIILGAPAAIGSAAFAILVFFGLVSPVS